MNEFRAEFAAYFFYKRYFRDDKHEDGEIRPSQDEMELLLLMRWKRLPQSIARLSSEDIDTLLRRKFIRKLGPDEEALGQVNTFTVIEVREAGARRRWITEPEYNDVLFADFKVTLPGPNECVSDFERLASKGRVYVTTVDFAFWYGQLALSESRQLLHTFVDHRGDTYALRVVPTGGRGVVGFAQSITCAMIHGLSAPSKKAYIDNIRLINLCPACAFDDVIGLNELCARTGAQLNETFAEILAATEGYSHNFLGLSYNHGVKISPEESGVRYGTFTPASVRLAPKTLKKCQALNLTINSDMKINDVLKFQGVIAHVEACRLLRDKMPYHVRKFIRRRLHDDPPKASKANPWPSIIPAWRDFMSSVCANKPRILHKSRRRTHRPTVILYTDASLSGWGATLLWDDGAVSYGGAWSRVSGDLAICELELHAILLATAQLKNFLPAHVRNVNIELRVDNTSAMWALRKERSSSYWMDSRIPIIKQHIKSIGNITSIEYIKSSDNLADYASRLFACLSGTN